jgi:DNA-binding response OmpR family regulator
VAEPTKTVLVVEDAEDVRELVRVVLERAGFEVVEAGDGHVGLRRFHRLHPDVVVLDVGLAVLDGWQVLERIRILSDETPVLMLTALGTELDKIRGLDGGADDYLVKPFATGELVARVRALGRRARPEERPRTFFDDGQLQIDYVRCQVENGGRSVRLTKTEFDLLWVLTQHRGQVLSPDQLIEQVWLDPNGLAPGKVRFAIGRLREAMEWDKDVGPLETVRGFGYRYRGT